MDKASLEAGCWGYFLRCPQLMPGRSGPSFQGGSLGLCSVEGTEAWGAELNLLIILSVSQFGGWAVPSGL